jgi:citrate synthase
MEIAAHDDVDAAAGEVVARWRARSPYIPGFGHRFHPVDPRRDPLLSLVDEAVRDGVVAGGTCAPRAVEEVSRRGCDEHRRRHAVIYAELGFAPPLAAGCSC